MRLIKSVATGILGLALVSPALAGQQLLHDNNLPDNTTPPAVTVPYITTTDPNPSFTVTDGNGNTIIITNPNPNKAYCELEEIKPYLKDPVTTTITPGTYTCPVPDASTATAVPDDDTVTLPGIPIPNTFLTVPGTTTSPFMNYNN